MKRPTIYTIAICIFIIILASIGAYLHYSKKQTELTNYKNASYGISFSYPSSYELTERTEGEATTVTLLKKGVLVPQDSDGSTAITIGMYPNAPTPQGKKTSADVWIRTATSSNFSLSPMSEPGSTTVAGNDARLYTWDGLYPATTVVTEHAGNILMFSVTYNGEGDFDIREDFTTLMQSVHLEDTNQ